MTHDLTYYDHGDLGEIAHVEPSKKIVWIVGQAYTDYHPQAWELVGIFFGKEKAIEVCKDERYFIAPIEIDAVAPDESTPLPNCFFPKGDIFPE
jgi:hypothetical protein